MNASRHMNLRYVIAALGLALIAEPAVGQQPGNKKPSYSQRLTIAVFTFGDAVNAAFGPRLSEAARSSRIKKVNIADACAMQISDLAGWVRGLDAPSVAP